jgi:hypothetical protein
MTASPDGRHPTTPPSSVSPRLPSRSRGPREPLCAFVQKHRPPSESSPKWVRSGSLLHGCRWSLLTHTGLNVCLQRTAMASIPVIMPSEVLHVRYYAMPHRISALGVVYGNFVGSVMRALTAAHFRAAAAGMPMRHSDSSDKPLNVACKLGRCRRAATGGASLQLVRSLRR